MDMGLSSVLPQLETRMSLRSELITPQPERAHKNGVDLAKAFEKRVANPVRLKKDHDPGRAEQLFQGYLRCIHTDKVPEINQKLDSTCQNFRSLGVFEAGSLSPVLNENDENSLDGRDYVVESCNFVISYVLTNEEKGRIRMSFY